MLTTQLDINTFFKDYYTRLYEAPNNLHDGAFDPLFDDIRLPQLTQEQCDNLTRPVTVAEIHQAIKSLPHNKSHGGDGLPAEFYITYNDLLAPHLLTIYQDSLEKSELPLTTLQALVISMLKPGRNALQIPN